MLLAQLVRLLATRLELEVPVPRQEETRTAGERTRWDAAIAETGTSGPAGTGGPRVIRLFIDKAFQKKPSCDSPSLENAGRYVSVAQASRD